MANGVVAANMNRSSMQAVEVAIRLRGVRKTFTQASGEEVVAVDGLDLDLPRGQFCCVLGPSGHGKTTILNLIAGFIKPSSGNVIVDGSEVNGPGPDRGVVFQQDTVFLWKRVSENIEFGLRARGVSKRERREIVERYLRLIDLEAFGGAWPKELSGGMRRRVAIAAALANNPKVLLMDEPFVGLDYLRRDALHHVLLDLWNESRNTVFFITHDIDEALALADRVIVITRGQVVLDVPVPFERPRSPTILACEEATQIRLGVLQQMGVTGDVTRESID